MNSKTISKIVYSMFVCVTDRDRQGIHGHTRTGTGRRTGEREKD